MNAFRPCVSAIKSFFSAPSPPPIRRSPRRLSELDSVDSATGIESSPRRRSFFFVRARLLEGRAGHDQPKYDE